MTTLNTEDRVIEHNGHVIKGETQQTLVKMLKKRPVKGYTAKEAREALELDHGKVSGALSILHQRGVVALLADKRDGYRIYVLAENVMGRPTKARKA